MLIINLLLIIFALLKRKRVFFSIQDKVKYETVEFNFQKIITEIVSF